MRKIEMFALKGIPSIVAGDDLAPIIEAAAQAGGLAFHDGDIVPFPGAAAALTATMSNQTEVAVVTLPPAVPLVTANKVKGIAVTTATRSAALPDVPTAVESGYPDVNSTVWTAFFVPAKTPDAVVSKLNDAVIKVAEMPEIKAQLSKLGFEPLSIPGEKFQHDVAAEMKLWAGIIEKTGAKSK
jgi:tripartite-type tricarboxylate transporter receptor subunit TctC